MAFIDEHIGELQANWEKRQVFRTETEMRISVLNDTKFPTFVSKYWQCVREQGGFYEELVNESFLYRRNKVDQQRTINKLAKAQAKNKPLKVLELEIRLEELQFQALSTKQKAEDRMRELRLWSALMEELVASDPGMDTDNVNTHQHISYLTRWHNQLVGLDRSKSSVSEVNNLVGQFKTGLRQAFDAGIALPDYLLADAKELGVSRIPSGLPFQIGSTAVTRLAATFTLHDTG